MGLEKSTDCESGLDANANETECESCETTLYENNTTDGLKDGVKDVELSVNENDFLALFSS